MPIQRVFAVFDNTDRDRGALEDQPDVVRLICEELNAKEFALRDDVTGLVRRVFKPELKALGPRLGKDLPRVRTALAEGRFTATEDGVEVEGFDLSLRELLISAVGTPGHAIGEDLGAIVVVETTLTPELEAEGLARELVHKLNDLRKEAGLEIADRIRLRYAGAIAPTVQAFRDLVARETLATSIDEGVTGSGHAWRGELNGVAAELELERA